MQAHLERDVAVPGEVPHRHSALAGMPRVEGAAGEDLRQLLGGLAGQGRVSRGSALQGAASGSVRQRRGQVGTRSSYSASPWKPRHAASL